MSSLLLRFLSAPMLIGPVAGRVVGVFNVAIAYLNFKFSFTIWMLAGRVHQYLEELRGAQSVNGNGEANDH